MVAEAMTEVALAEETRNHATVGQVGKKRMQVRKAHSLIGQIHDPRNVVRAWERVRANRGAGGVDRVSIDRFDCEQDRYLTVLRQRLADGRYRPQPVRRVEIDKPGSTAKRPLGIPTVMDRVCQQAIRQVLEPIFEPTFSEVSFGFRPKRSAHMAMRRIWGQLQAGGRWIVDADIADFFGTISHDRLVSLVAERVADGKVLSLIRQILTAGALRDGVYESTVAGTPQGGVISPLLSNIYLHVFDERMERAGFQVTRYADDWLAVCRTREEAERALASACAVLEELGLRIHPEKTRIVHVSQGFEFLGYKIGLGKGLRFKQGGIGLYAIPRQQSIDRFKDKVRALTRRRIAVPLEELIDMLNPVIRGWGMYYRRANVRRLFNRLNMWIVRRIWGWRFKRWRNAGWRTLPEKRLYGEYGLVNLLQLIPSMRDYYRQKGYTH
ncbi:group II intron reverse transcriptase/maturase [Saccharopolyspora phatthalungensis]|uniref:Group II intron reverse transcriptase/maturase n=2 Tax=Saccharopolyspora phatthalungensis TaxID=664693 RepID=A0A840QAT3_9PSEU|nr:group II intron reverse transcriptase/maturase [Saccharopolyspora phatthalungensis]MBB5156881.1 group II intron reverse transcriptase/maturase [Saccharopolyspora phatthalungensis]